MLYVNVYHVSQLYGGPEEGGWYYDAGEPIASIPVKSILQRGKDYYISSDTEGFGRKAKVTNIKINVRDCYGCKGTGEFEKEAEEWETPAGEEPAVYTCACQECGELPEDLEATAKLMVDMYAMFDQEGTASGRYDTITVMLQDYFAIPYPRSKPHYE